MKTYGIRCMRAAVIGAAVLGFVGSAAAAEPTASEIATARKLIDLKGASGIYDPIFIGIIQKTKYTFLQTNPMLSGDLDAVASNLVNEYRPRLEQLKNEVAKRYAEHFSEAELNQAYAFYSSPVGAKLIKAEPEILDDSMKFAAGWADKLAAEVMVKMREEMHKRGHDL